MQIQSPIPARPFFRAGDLFIALALAAVLYFGARLAAGAPERLLGPFISLDPGALPYYALRSLLRMIAAYSLALGFTLAYGYIAAKNRRAESIMLPALDVLQSVPILSFMPVAVLSLITLFPANIGLELAAILLIFTSQVWNMAFSFYHSLITIPRDMSEASKIFGIYGWLRFRTVEVPFATIGLVWNSMMSWAGGWFFLMASEQFVLGERDFRLPGIGSYLKTAAEVGDITAILWGLFTLVTLIVALDQFVWRPVLAWADRFKLTAVEAEAPPRSWVLDLLARSLLIEKLQAAILTPLGEAIDTGLSRGIGAVSLQLPPVLSPWLKRLGIALLVVIGAIAVFGAARVAGVLTEIGWAQWLTIVAGSVATFGRVVAAQALALAWTLPIGVAIGTNRRLAHRIAPVVQVAASVPATALFPVLLLVLLGLPGGVNIAAILLMLLGTQWYLLFNVIAGAMSIPDDLRYTTATLGIKGLEYWRSFIVPAIFPSLITGMVTSTGGAWNASIVSEYVRFSGVTYSTFGLGAIIAQSSEAADFQILLVSTLTMVGIVALLNRLLWRRLYALAEERFHLD